MSTTTSTTLTVCESMLVAAAIVDIIERRGHRIQSVGWAQRSLSTPGHVGEGVGVLLQECNEDDVDALAGVFRLKPEHPSDRGYANYRRVGEWGGMVLSVTSGRSRPMCACGAQCAHDAVQA